MRQCIILWPFRWLPYCGCDSLQADQFLCLSFACVSRDRTELQLSPIMVTSLEGLKTRMRNTFVLKSTRSWAENQVVGSVRLSRPLCYDCHLSLTFDMSEQHSWGNTTRFGSLHKPVWATHHSRCIRQCGSQFLSRLCIFSWSTLKLVHVCSFLGRFHLLWWCANRRNFVVQIWRAWIMAMVLDDYVKVEHLLPSSTGDHPYTSEWGCQWSGISPGWWHQGLLIPLHCQL